MRLPHDSVTGTFLTGIVLTVVFWLIVRAMVGG